VEGVEMGKENEIIFAAARSGRGSERGSLDNPC
jgi:hypothetical protein